jgi:methyltransferase (TIGR00027 family)
VDTENEAEVSGVADTALWVATLRAIESKRADAIFSDPLAEMLAGKRGPMIARSLYFSSMEPWGFVLRTSAIDRLIREALHAGVDSVVNLGAGLDSRPYRLDLPSDLRWIEVDLPELIDAKNAQLLNHAPKCHVERVGLDLRNLKERGQLFARIGASSASTLLIAEGVIPYLSNDVVGGLAEELHTVPAFRRWILDFVNAGKRAMPRKWAKQLNAAPFLFQVDDWFEFFGKSGWRSQVVVTTLEESVRMARPLPLDFPRGFVMRALPRDLRRRILSVSGAVLLERETPRQQAGVTPREIPSLDT